MQLNPSQLSPSRLFRMFSSSADAPRRRRPTDVLLLLLSLLLLLLLDVNAPGPTAIDESLSALLADAGGVLDWLWRLSYVLMAAWLVVLVLAPVVRFRQGRLPLLLDYLLALLLALGFALGVGALAGTDVATSVDALRSTDTGPVYVAVRLALVVAVTATASPHLTRPFRVVGRVVMLLGAVSTVALGLAYASGALAAVAVGLGSAATVHLLRGSPGGLLVPRQVGEALAELGIETTLVTTLPALSPGEQRMLATAADGEQLQVKVLGRDAWDAQYVGSLWTSLTRRGEAPRLTMNRRERVDHEAMVLLMAERAGVPVLPVVGAGQGVQGEAMLVTSAPGRSLDDLPADELTDDRLRAAWSALTGLHGQGIAHRQVTGEHLVDRQDGTLAWADAANARLAGSTTDLMLDRTHLLVTTWLLVGPERAVNAAVQALGVDGLKDSVPYLQDPALTPPLRRAMGTDRFLDDLREHVVRVTGAEEVEGVQLRRVSGVSVVKLLVTLVVVSSLISLFAGVDVDQLLDELRNADVALLLLALLVAPLAQLSFSFSTLGATLKHLPFIPVLVLQYAIQFVALVLPSTGARVAVQIRFFERLGIPYGASTSMGLVDGASGLSVQIGLLLLIGLSALPGATTEVDTAPSSGDEASSGPSLLALILVLAVIWIVATLVSPQRRARARRAIPRYREALADEASTARSALQVLRHPRNLSMMTFGNLGGQVVQAIVLGICLSAFGESATLSQLILVNTFVSLFAGFIPVPGGIGVAEAGYTYGLIAVGVPSPIAMATAIAFRLVTFYLPPLWGSFAMRWLRKNAYV